jgi:hypothetical protein
MAKAKVQAKLKSPKDWIARIRRVCLIAGALGVLAYAGLDLIDYALRSDLFMVQDVAVEGNCLVSDDDILAALDIPAVIRLWQIDPQLLEARILALPQIHGAEVRRVLPQSVAVTVEERKPIADWQDPHSGKRFAVDEEGVLLAEAETIEARGPDLGPDWHKPGQRPEIVGLEDRGLEPGDRLTTGRVTEVLKAVGLALSRGEEWAGKLAELRATADQRGWVLKCRGESGDIVLGDRRFVERVGRVQPVWRFLRATRINVAYLDLRFDGQGVLIKPTNCDAKRWMEVVAHYPPPAGGREAA